MDNEMLNFICLRATNMKSYNYYDFNVDFLKQIVKIVYNCEFYIKSNDAVCYPLLPFNFNGIKYKTKFMGVIKNIYVNKCTYVVLLSR